MKITFPSSTTTAVPTLFPFKIDFKGKSNSNYLILNETTTFRGRLLVEKVVDLPAGYNGVLDGDTFTSLSMYGIDKQGDRNSCNVIKSLDYLQVCDLIHGQVSII